MRNVASATKVAAAIVVAAVIIALALILRPEAGRFRFDTTNRELQRFDTATGDIRVCRDGQCSSLDMDKAALN